MPQTCLIIPCYNEEMRLNTAAYIDFLKRYDISLCFVDDGSGDNTYQKLLFIQEQFSSKVFIKKLSGNKGKAEAVREGILFCRNENGFDYLGFYDADLSAPLETAANFINHLSGNEPVKVVFGSRIKTKATFIKRNYWRHIGGRIFSFIINHYLHIKLYDTQCGAKVFKKEIIEPVFAEPFLSRWLFDIEILLRLRKFYNHNDSFVAEIPLPEWKNRRGSKITAGDLIHLPGELRRIKKKYQ